MDRRAIGVFDSGLGGLTAVKEIKKIMPNENVIYFGDTARVPYGTKTKSTIEKYGAQDINFLLNQDVKIIVAACGTVSSNPSSIIKDLPIAYTGILNPAVNAAVNATKNEKVAVIATNATIKSDEYKKTIKSINPNISVLSKACPLFVPLVENGYIYEYNNITTLVAKEYLNEIIENEFDTIILGCTHYPIIKKLISHLVDENVKLIDPGKETALYVKNLLSQNNMLNDTENIASYKYFVSDDIENFSNIAEIFLNENNIKNNAQKINIEEY